MAEHWCSEHETVFFKRGKMKTFAHPIKDEEGNSTGEWCNEAEQEIEPAGTRGQSRQKPPAMSKDDWAEKDRITRKSIERQQSLEQAVNLCIANKIPLEKIGSIAKTFEAYLEGKDVPAKSKLIDEAKKLGATES